MDAHSAVDAYQAWLDTVEFDSDGYITTIIQDRQTRDILRLGRMDREALEQTLATGRTWLYSKKQRRLWHRSGSGAAFRPVVEILDSGDGGALIFYVDRVSGNSAEPARFRSALVRFDDDVVAAPGLAAMLEELCQLFMAIAARLRVLPGGLDHTFRKLRSMLREAERSVMIDQDRLRESVAALIARLLIFAAARGVVLRELVVSVHEQMAAQAFNQTGGGLSEECR